MNIAIVLLKYNPHGGYERQAAILAEELAVRGDNVTVFANKWVGTSSNVITFCKVPVIKYMSPLKVLSFALLSKYYLNRSKGKFDIVIAFDRTLIMDIYRAGNACHKEWISIRKRYGSISDHISIAVNPLHIIINRIEKQIFSHIQKKGGFIVVLSHAGALQIRKHYPVSEDLFIIIPPVMDMKHINITGTQTSQQRMEVRNRLKIKNNTLLLLHVGSGFLIKGLSSTIQALSILTKRGISAELIVVGRDNSGTRRCNKLCRKLGIEQQVHFMGGVKETESYYIASDIFVLPSLFDTFCISAIEALSYGLPVIIGRGAGVSPIIEKYNIGKVFDLPANSDKLADIIEELVVSEERLRLSGKVAEVRRNRASIASKFSSNNVMKEFFFAIDQISDREGHYEERKIHGTF